MSSDHIIIVARNLKTGELHLPLGNMTLYGVGTEERLLTTVRRRFDDSWVLTLYRPGDWFIGLGTRLEMSIDDDSALEKMK